MRRRAKRGRAMSPKSEKGRLMGQIRRHASAAAILRLRGLIPGAMRYEEDLDRAVSRAEAKGWADDAMSAEERGRHEGQRVFDRDYR